MSLVTTSGGGGGDSSTGEPYVPSQDATDQCGFAPVIGAGRHEGTLRGNASELGGACGLGGPDAFFRLEVPRRSDVRLQGQGVGFVPRVGVLPFTCSTDWIHRTLACTEGVGTWLADVAEGSSLVVSVGVDEDHPALDLPPPMQGPDPLAFVLDVELRNVLEAGDPCEPSGLGRCGTGTACLPTPPPDDEAEDEPGPAVCTTLPGDTCETALPWPVVAGVQTMEIDPSTPQTDAHRHSCGGARRLERVVRLMLPQGGPRTLEVRSDRAEVGFAVRAPGCGPEDERGCVAPEEIAPAALSVELDGSDAFLFVELPPIPEDADEEGSSGGEVGEEAPIVLELELLDP